MVLSTADARSRRPCVSPQIRMMSCSSHLCDLESATKNQSITTWMSRWKLGSMVSKWVITYLQMGYIGGITHLVTIDPNFQPRHPSRSTHLKEHTRNSRVVTLPPIVMEVENSLFGDKPHIFQEPIFPRNHDYGRKSIL